MIPLNVLLTAIQSYSKVIFITIASMAILATGAYIGLLRHERNDARAEKAKLQVVVDGYVAATKALQAKLDTASKALDEEDLENKKLMADLSATVPKDPAQATAWAIAAAQKIGKEAQR